MQPSAIAEFQEIVWRYYDQHGRDDLLWRQPEPDGSFDPYKIMVSEIMLQQTQVGRVTPKFTEFLQRFPKVDTLATAELGEVLRVWQGLGYNRRAKFLWQAAQQVLDQNGGIFPREQTELVKLPGIGKNTAGAIVAYAFNMPAAFVETNIRTVFIYHFLVGQTTVSETEIETLVRQTLPEDPTQTRQWYWALMDYGSFLKQTQGNLNKLSKSYVKQSTFHGSKRQLRGAVIRTLYDGPAALPHLQQLLPDERLDTVLADLVAEQMIRQEGDRYFL